MYIAIYTKAYCIFSKSMLIIEYGIRLKRELLYI